MSNAVKTTALLAALTVLFVLVGGVAGGDQGMLGALLFAGMMNVAAYWWSDRIVLRMYGAQEVTEAEAPELHSLVRRLAQRAGLPMPMDAHPSTAHLFIVNPLTGAGLLRLFSTHPACRGARGAPAGHADRLKP